MGNLKKELLAFKKATRVEIGKIKQTIDRKFEKLSSTMDNGFDRLIIAMEQFDYLEKDLSNPEERVSKIEKKLD